MVALTLPVAIAGASAAALVSVCTRFWLVGESHGPTATMVGLVCGAVVGAALARTSEGSRKRPSLESLVIVLSIGPAAGVVVGLACDPDETIAALFAGLLASLLVLPVLFVLAHASHRARRSRDRSLVGRVDRRGPWIATAAALSIGSFAATIYAITCNAYWTNRYIELVEVPAAVADVGLAIALIVVMLDLLADRRARRLAALHGLREATSAAEATANTIDIGIGGHAWTDEASIENYRGRNEERVAVLGDAALAPQLTRLSVRTSLAVCAFAAFAALFALSAVVEAM